MQNSNIEVSYKFFVSYSLDLFLKGKCSVFCFSVFLYIVCLYFAGLDFLRERTISTTSRSWLQKWVATTQAKRSNSSMSWYLGLTYLGIRLDFCVEWLREWKIYSMSHIRYLAFPKNLPFNNIFLLSQIKHLQQKTSFSHRGCQIQVIPFSTTIACYVFYM